MKINKTFVIFFCILLLGIFSFGFGNDYYWHTKVGEYIVSNLKIPYHDIFSWFGIENNLYWISQEWLSEVIIYLFDSIFKSFGPFMFTFINYIFIILLLYYFNKERLNKNIIYTFIWALVGLLIFSSVMLPRPHMLSYILLIFTIFVLYDNFNNEDSKKIYFLPVISLIWSNVHGGSANLSYILCFLFLTCALFEFKFNKLFSNKITKKQIQKFVIFGIISIFTILINPHGVKMLFYPYVNMADGLMLSSIEEWASPSLNNPNDFIVFIMMILIVLILVITNKKIKLVDLIILGFFIILGFKSVRFAPLLYIASTFIIFNYVKNYKFEVPNLLFVILIALIILMGGMLSYKLVNNYNKTIIPNEIITYIKDKKPKSMFNYYNYGGYLIYNDIKVFIDGRADMYSKYNLNDAILLQNYGYDRILLAYDFDMIVIPKNLGMTEHLNKSGNYILKKIIEDTAIYEKTS